MCLTYILANKEGSNVLTDEQKAKLRKVARPPYHQDLGKENARLMVALSELMEENPKAFLLNEDLPLRRFFHTPLGIIPFLTSEKDKL